jgi:hypothetical protein
MRPEETDLALECFDAAAGVDDVDTLQALTFRLVWHRAIVPTPEEFESAVNRLTAAGLLTASAGGGLRLTASGLALRKRLARLVPRSRSRRLAEALEAADDAGRSTDRWRFDEERFIALRNEAIRHHLDRLQDRRQIVDDLLRAADQPAALLAATHQAPDDAAALQTLMHEPFAFDELSAMHVLDMPLRRFTATNRARLAEERAQLDEQEAYLLSML